MSSDLLSRVKRALNLEKDPPIHPIDRRLAKEWIKRRLAHVYPDLRHDPKALELAYREIGLDARPGVGPDEPPTVFEMRMPSHDNS